MSQTTWVVAAPILAAVAFGLLGCATAPTIDSLWQQQAESWGRQDTPEFRRDATACVQEAQAAMGGVTSSSGSGAGIGAAVPIAHGFAIGGVVPVGDDPVQRTFFRLREQCMYGRGYSRYDSPAMREEVVLDCKRHYPKQLGMFESELRAQDKCIEEGLQGLKDGPR